MTDIEWTHAPGFKGESWNPIVGCALESPGCTNCYAMRKAWRLAEISKGKSKGAHGLTHYQGLTKKVKGRIVWTGKVKHGSEKLITSPLRWKKPRMIFVNSMGDLFHEYIPDHEIDRLFAIMALCPQHRFLILTKRAERMREYMSDPETPLRIYDLVCDMTLAMNIRVALIADPAHEKDAPPAPRVYLGQWPLPNVWLGVSAEDQTRADERIPHLLSTPAAVRFISAEPLLGPVDFITIHVDRAPEYLCQFGDCGWRGEASEKLFSNNWGFGICPKCRRPVKPSAALDWVIAGGESGPGARPAHPDWFRDLRDQCSAAGVPYFFKQWGSYLPVGQTLPGFGKIHGATAVKPGRMKLHYGGTPQQAPQHAFADHGVEFTALHDGALTFRVGKTKAGAILDGREHREFPEART